MKQAKALPLFLAAFVLSVTASAQSFADKFTIESAETVLNIGERIERGEVIGEADWDSLFATKGYSIYNMRDSQREKIKDAMMLAFNPARRAEADSICQLRPKVDTPALVLCQNLCRLAKRTQEARHFLGSTDFARLLAKADSMVQNFIPRRATKGTVALNDLHLICFIPDATVRDKAVLMDLNLALNMSEDEIVRLLAHEFFHNYRDAAYNIDSRDTFLKVFSHFQNEGMADLIDKNEQPEKLYVAFGEDYARLFLHELADAPQTLLQIDSLLTAYKAEGNANGGEYGPLVELFVFNGHPVGMYMARLIREQGLLGKLIAQFDNPYRFALIYNEAAKRKNRHGGHEYTLSQALLQHLKQCSQ